MKSYKTSTKGFSFIELMVVLSIIAIIALPLFKANEFYRESTKIKAAAVNMRELSTSCASYMSHNYTRLIDSDTGVIEEHTGVGFLRDGACRGGNNEKRYLRCDYKKPSMITVEPKIIIEKRAVSDTQLLVATVNIGAFHNEALEVDLAGMGQFIREFNSITAKLVQAGDNVSALVNKSNGEASLELVIEHAANIDDFLRADGTVKAQGNFDWNYRDIKKVNQLGVNKDICIAFDFDDENTNAPDDKPKVKGEWLSNLVSRKMGLLRQGETIEIPQCRDDNRSLAVFRASVSVNYPSNDIRKGIQAWGYKNKKTSDGKHWVVRAESVVNGERVIPPDDSSNILMSYDTYCALPDNDPGCQVQLEKDYKSENE